MTIKRNYMIFLLFIVLLCCTSAVSAVDYNDTIDNVMSEVDSNDEFVSVSADDQVNDVDETVLSAQDEYDNLTMNNNDEVLSIDSNEDSLGVTTSETNNYLNDIKASTSNEFYKFTIYLVKQKNFKFKSKTNNEGYSIYSTSKYTSTLFDGENYVLSAGTSYFMSKNRMGYVIMGEYYPDVLYAQNDNIYVDELYLGWLKNVENYHYTLTIEDSNEGIVQAGASSNGLIDTVINGASVNGNPINSPQEISNLPSAFDLRNVSGQNYVTSVKNQAGASTCWIFASIAALESHLLKTENKTYDFSINYDFSENNLKNVMSNIGRQGINRTVTEGGNINMALAYFLRWSGPVLDEFDKYELEGLNPVNNIPIEFSNVAKHVQGYKYIQKRNNESDNDEIKKSIMYYGGVVTSMWWLNNYEIKDNYYYNGFANERDSEGKLINAGHEICIIGWDDTYSADNFYNQKLNIKPKGNGAFIIKNSWGDNYGKDGYYYVSYYDTQIARRVVNGINSVGFSFTLVENNTNYGENYNYHPLGVSLWTPVSDYNSYFSECVANNDETLKACGIYVHGACNCTVDVFLDYYGGVPYTQEKYQLDYAGFHTISFSSSVPVKKGQTFIIRVTIESNTQVYVPLEVNVDNKYYSTVEINLLKTGFIKKGVRKAYRDADFCINIYTEYNKLPVSKIDVVDALFHNGVFDVKSKVLDSNNNLLKNFEIIYSPDISGGVKEYQFLKTNDDGEVTLTFSKGIKIINNQLSVSFAFYDALASPIIRKTININCPSIIEGNIESISTSTHAKIGSINIKGNVGSISTGTQSNITSINVEGNVGSISTGTQSNIGSIKVSGDSWSISTGTQGKITSIIVEGTIETISTGKQGSIGSIDVKSNVGSISTGTQGKINSININGHSGSISTGTQGKISSIKVEICSGTIKAGRQGKIESCNVG